MSARRTEPLKLNLFTFLTGLMVVVVGGGGVVDGAVVVVDVVVLTCEV